MKDARGLGALSGHALIPGVLPGVNLQFCMCLVQVSVHAKNSCREYNGHQAMQQTCISSSGNRPHHIIVLILVLVIQRRQLRLVRVIRAGAAVAAGPSQPRAVAAGISAQINCKSDHGAFACSMWFGSLLFKAMR